MHSTQNWDFICIEMYVYRRPVNGDANMNCFLMRKHLLTEQPMLLSAEIYEIFLFLQEKKNSYLHCYHNFQDVWCAFLCMRACVLLEVFVLSNIERQ